VPDSTDPTINAIDRLFDFVDSGVDKIDRVLNRAKYTEELHHARRAKIIDSSPKQRQPGKQPAKQPAKKVAAPVSTTALARKSRYYIVESITPTGTLFIVTDGGARAECATRELAVKILHALETM
jgi:hypothetical protein